MHIGRSFRGTNIEDVCPCEKASCGLVIAKKALDECEHHSVLGAKTIRQGHKDEDCPSNS